MGEKKPIVKILPGTVCSKYRLYQKLGSGSFGDIYLAYNLENGEQVAAKVESSNARDPRLEEEFKIYGALQGGVGIPHMRWIGSGNGMNILVMDLLGPSLEDLFDSCGRMFSLNSPVFTPPARGVPPRYDHRAIQDRFSAPRDSS